MKERSVQATAPTRNLDLAASASSTPPGLRSRGFHIFVDPPSPTGESKRSDGRQWPPKNIQPPNTPRDSCTIKVQNHDGETGHPEHNLLPQTVPTQSLYAWIPAEVGSIGVHTTKCRSYPTIKFCWEGRALKQFFLSLVTDHWIGEVIKWTDGVGQATPGVRCPQHRVGLCPVTLKRFRETLSAKDKEKQLK